MLREALLALFGISIAMSGAIAQDEGAGEEAPAPPQAPWTVGADPRDSWTLNDELLLDLTGGLTGSFTTGDGEYTPGGVHLHIAPVSVEGLDNALFYELHRADDPAHPFRSGVIHAYYYQDNPRLRFFDFSNDSMTDAMAGLWAAPYAFGPVSVDDLDPAWDVQFTSGGGGYVGSTPHPYPTTTGGAVEMTSSMTIKGNEITILEQGLNAAGEVAWGPSEPLVFGSAKPDVTVTTKEGGLVILDIVVPEDAPTLESGGEIAVHYTGYLDTGEVFDSSREEGRSPFRVRIPGRLIPGFNEGMLGMALGGQRRIIIPSHLGYGPRGAGSIPPDSTLIFDIEGLWISNPEAVEEAPEGDAAAEEAGAAEEAKAREQSGQ